jgi:hypothetical protein
MPIQANFSTLFLSFAPKTSLETVSQRHWNGKHGEIWHYRFAQQVPLRNGDDALLVNWFELVITHEATGAILYQNSFVTNHTITTINVV